MPKELLPHIQIGSSEDGRVYLVIDDLELFDFIDDHLTEECSIFSESHTSEVREGGEIITLYFPISVEMKQVEEGLAKLTTESVEEIYRINNDKG
jgi:hypothetical protein